MNHPYIPHTEAETSEMLATIGASSLDDLFRTIPEEVRKSASAVRGLFPALSEQEVFSKLKSLAELNLSDSEGLSFLGGGCGRHYVPAAINYLVQRGEFLTSYTPYQPEVAQGNLQALFEFQTMVTELTGLEVANAGLYDAGTALVEAALMSIRVAKDRKILVVSEALSPAIRGCLKTVTHFLDQVEVVQLPYDTELGSVDLAALDSILNQHGSKVAAVLVGYPNYFGIVEDLAAIAQPTHNVGALLISLTSEALALGMFRGPGELGADIAVGDLQSFGVSPSFGGPWCGFMATKESMLRQMPGRLVGETTDTDGRRGFVLTLSTREQHIRRERATSNICTNNALLSLSAAIYLSLYGPQGLRKLAELNYSRRAYLEDRLKEKGLRVRFTGPRFNQFVLNLSGAIHLEDLAAAPKGSVPEGSSGSTSIDRGECVINALLEAKKIMIGPGLGKSYQSMKDSVLIGVTELNDRAALDILVQQLGNILKG